MSNLIVLCHRCFGWVEPISDNCPECGVDIDLDEADPDREVLAQLIGEAVSFSGPVRIDRRSLPHYGQTIVTTGGLLFVPRMHRRLNGALAEVTSQRSANWWPFPGDPASPRFLSWLRRPSSDADNDELPARRATEPEPEPLVDRLLESPGAFFIARQTIRSITARRRSVQINRTPSRTMTIFDETEDGTLVGVLQSLYEQQAGM